MIFVEGRDGKELQQAESNIDSRLLDNMNHLYFINKG